MEFLDELNYLSVIEEERESGDGDSSTEEVEMLKWKTRYEVSEITRTNEVRTRRKSRDKGISKIPIRRGRLLDAIPNDVQGFYGKDGAPSVEPSDLIDIRRIEQSGNIQITLSEIQEEELLASPNPEEVENGNVESSTEENIKRGRLEIEDCNNNESFMLKIFDIDVTGINMEREQDDLSVPNIDIIPSVFQERKTQEETIHNVEEQGIQEYQNTQQNDDEEETFYSFQNSYALTSMNLSEEHNQISLLSTKNDKLEDSSIQFEDCTDVNDNLYVRDNAKSGFQDPSNFQLSALKNINGLSSIEYVANSLDSFISEDTILEAPVEFRTVSDNLELHGNHTTDNQVPPPQPPSSIPEKEPPNRDYDNTNSTETGDTTQRLKATGENESSSEDEKTEENRTTQENHIGDSNGTGRNALVTLANSTGDNDHVKLEGDSQNVTAFEHVGYDAPIQRHDMLQIDHNKRVETEKRIVVEANGSVLDLLYQQQSLCQLSNTFGGVSESSNAKRCEKSENGVRLSFHVCSSGNSECCAKSVSVVDEDQIANVENNCEVDLSNVDISDVEASTFSESDMIVPIGRNEGLRTNSETCVDIKQDNNNNFTDLNISYTQPEDEDERALDSGQDFPATSSPSGSGLLEEERRLRVLVDAHLCESRFPKLSSSIHAESGVPAPAPGCSPTKTAAPAGCVVSRQAPHRIDSPSCNRRDREERAEEDVHDLPDGYGENRDSCTLRWSFKNGRLVFDSESDSTNDNNGISADDCGRKEANLDSIESSEFNIKLTSKEINRRIDENKSRLKYLEDKLKKAGISDESRICLTNEEDCDESGSDVAKQVVDELEADFEERKESRSCDSNRSLLEDNDDGNYGEGYVEELIGYKGGEEFCQFDVSQVGSFPTVLNSYCLVYDELNEVTDSEEDEFHVILEEETDGFGEQLFILSKNHKNLRAKMGTDSDKPKHNPDTENLKSLLKRPGRNKEKKNRVVFNEHKNEFFDADYIIMIREECDYDDEDEDCMCTCNQHEMVRLTCCEPNCNCSVYEGYDPTPQSPKFAPPLEFVDAVTLSPPEGYKDMELGEQQLYALQQMRREQQQRRACRECCVTHDDDEDDGDGSQSDEGGGQYSDQEEQREREKTDQSQQTTPTTPENCIDDSSLQDFAIERSPMTLSESIFSSDDERREERPRTNVPSGGSPISGILKGGKLWKQSSTEGGIAANIPSRPQELQQNSESSITSDEEGSTRRFVRFIESESQDQRGGCDGAPDDHIQVENRKEESAANEDIQNACNISVSPESTEMMLTFKLGNHVLISNNSLKPNSAVRQLFPCTKPANGKDEENQQYLVTAESLRAFEEAKRSKLPQIIQSGETDESIKRAIERNTLRRSLIRYEPRSKKSQPKTDNSLVERIKQLTCDVDDTPLNQDEEDIHARASPPGEEARNSPEVTALKQQDKSFSPSSSSTASSNSSSVSSTYKKITDLFTKKIDKPLDSQNNLVNTTTQDVKVTPTLPDLGNGPHELDHVHLPVSRISSSTNESRKQFLASLAPLTACVGGVGNADDYYYQMNNIHHGGERASVASSVGTEYSLEDIDEALRNDQEDPKRITPDVLAGTPSASESGDELAMFVQQDAGRIERIKKKYQPEADKDEDDEHDDYGFNKRPSVRGIKPRFGTTTQIIQQIQNQMQPPEPAARVSWPYYSESGLSNVDNSKAKNPNQNVPYAYPPSMPENRGYPPVYRPTSLTEENMYQSGQFCKQVYKMNGNPNNYPTLMKVSARCNDMYQSLPRQKSNGRPLSPPPLEMSKTYHQTMVYIPYNHIEGCQGAVSPNVYYQQNDYARVTNQNQINKRYIEPIYQQRFHMHIEDHHYNASMVTTNHLKQMTRIPYQPQGHGITSRSESPLPGQFSTARATQTPVPNCNYYSNPRYRPVVGPVWQGEPTYVSKMNRHSFPMGPRYSTSDTSTDTDSTQGLGPVQNGYRQSIEISFATQKENLGSSPTKPKFTERGVPEGAASVSPPDTLKSNNSTMTSPTSPQNAPIQTQKPMFYAMNV